MAAYWIYCCHYFSFLSLFQLGGSLIVAYFKTLQMITDGVIKEATTT